MKLKPYKKNKPSGVEWLGDVPEHWAAQGVKFCYSIQLGKMLQPEPSSPTDEETPYLKSQHVQWEHVRVTELPTMWTNNKERQQYAVRDGDLLVCEGGDVGRAAVVRGAPEGTIIQNALHRVRPQGENETGFLLYVLAHAASQGWFEIICNKSTIAHFTVDKFGALGVALPTPDEQRSIAAFLDRETERVDRLVAKKRELIERLNEKRSALISRTVTRGLPPAAAKAAGLPVKPKMKDSGFEWLGEIPEHWEFKKLRYLCEITTGDKDTVDAVDGGEFPFFVRSQTVERINSYSFDCEAVLTAGDGVGVGKVFHHHQGKFAVHQRVYVLHNFWKISGRYLFMFMKEFFARVALGGEAKSTVDSLRRPIFTDFIVLLPPLAEQTAIATHLDRETSKLDALVAKVEEAVERLQEYRSALITAAVTGKIDVRATPVPMVNHGKPDLADLASNGKPR